MPDYKLNLCRTCMQMTNHLGGVCQKCKPENVNYNAQVANNCRMLANTDVPGEWADPATGKKLYNEAELASILDDVENASPRPRGSLCSDCGRTANNMTCIKKYGQAAKQEAFSVSTMRKGTCCVCGQIKHVTEQRDFFYPDARALKLLRRYLTKGKIKEDK